MIIMRLYVLIPGKVLSKGTFTSTLVSSALSVSPAIATKPPIGIILNEYVVSLNFFLKSRGPIPIENSWQYTLNIFAAIKCPNS